jgi:hypothetical protein
VSAAFQTEPTVNLSLYSQTVVAFVCLTMSATIADDQISQEQSHTLVMGVMGVGTFVLGFLFLLVAVIWFLSYSCAPLPKTVWRGISTTVLLIIALIIVYAPRTNRYENTSLEPNVRRITARTLDAMRLIMLCITTADIRLFDYTEDYDISADGIICCGSRRVRHCSISGAQTGKLLHSRNVLCDALTSPLASSCPLWSTSTPSSGKMSNTAGPLVT